MKVIAHRGASGEYPENTLTAFEKAIEQGADGIELDVQYHTDGFWWILHDLYVDKTTNGQGRLQALTTEQIQQLTTRDQQPLLTLEQALAHINGRIAVNIEVKISTGDTVKLAHIAKHLVLLLTQLVKKRVYSWQMLTVSSFNHLFLTALSREIPDIAIGMLIAHCPADLALSAEQLGATTINPCIDCLNKALVDDAHQRGLEVWVYTVDRAADLDFCRAIDVDAVFTNFPSRTKSHLFSNSY